MISDKIYKLTSFQRQYKAILSLSVSTTIETLKWANTEEELLSNINWNNMTTDIQQIFERHQVQANRSDYFININ